MRSLRLFGLFLVGAVSLPAAPRPNVILILSDDMGYSDLGCYGSEIPTPALDALAAGGVRFTQFYNGARCCPTRAALLTGLYAHQAGVGHMVEDLGTPAYQGELNRRSVTIAEVLRTAGYRTYMAGKYHDEGNKAMRQGPWKLVSKHKQGWELYNIDDDRTELRDLAAAQPERVRTMAAQWQAWGDRVGVMPWGFEIPEGSGASPTGKKEKAAKNP